MDGTDDKMREEKPSTGDLESAAEKQDGEDENAEVIEEATKEV